MSRSHQLRLLSKQVSFRLSRLECCLSENFASGQFPSNNTPVSEELIGSGEERFACFQSLIYSVMVGFYRCYSQAVLESRVLPESQNRMLSVIQKRWKDTTAVPVDTCASLYFRLVSSQSFVTAQKRWTALALYVNTVLVKTLFSKHDLLNELGSMNLVHIYSEAVYTGRAYAEQLSSEVTGILEFSRQNRGVVVSDDMNYSYEARQSLQARVLVGLVFKSGLLGGYTRDPFSILSRFFTESNFSEYPDLIEFVKEVCSPDGMSSIKTFASLFRFLQKVNEELSDLPEEEEETNETNTIDSNQQNTDSKLAHTPTPTNTPRTTEEAVACSGMEAMSIADTTDLYDGYYSDDCPKCSTRTSVIGEVPLRSVSSPTILSTLQDSNKKKNNASEASGSSV